MMAYEYVTNAGVLVLQKQGEAWRLAFEGEMRGRWRSADAAARAAARHRSGLHGWDRSTLYAPDELAAWRPLGKCL